MTALMVASQKGHLEVVKFLLQMEAQVNAQSKVAATILHKEVIKYITCIDGLDRLNLRHLHKPSCYCS